MPMWISKSWFAAALTAVLAHGSAASAQDHAAENSGLVAPSAFDLQLGDHALQLPISQFRNFACGTNGGPPSLTLDDWVGYSRCPVEADTGLHEVYFEYDNEMELWAKANNLDTMAAVYQYTSAYGIPVIASGLFDGHGFLRGLRLVSDPRVPGAIRAEASEIRELGSTLGGFLKARYGVDGWECDDLPNLEGETPYQGRHEKRRCVKDLSDPQSRAMVETHHYRKKGQTTLDHANRATEGLFVSQTVFELQLTGELKDAEQRLALIMSSQESMGAERSELVQRAKDCAGCDFSGSEALRGADLSGANLTGADLSDMDLERANLTNAILSSANLTGANLKRADLTGADLAGATLTGANLHEANLRNANLTGASGEDANLNGADIRLATLADAEFSRVMLYRAALDGADLSGANFTEAKARHVTMSRAAAQDAVMVLMDLRDSRLNDADFRGADIRASWLDDAQMTRSDFTGALLSQSLMRNANLSNAKLIGATLRAANLSQAQLFGTDMTNADFSFATLLYADFTDAIVTGAIWTDAKLSRGSLPR